MEESIKWDVTPLSFLKTRKNRMKELLKHFFVYGISATIGKFIAFFLLPIYASIFTPTDYGNLDFILSLNSIIAIFGMFQIESGLQRFYYEQDNDKEQKHLLSTAFNFTLVCSVIITILSICSISYMSRTFFDNGYSTELLIAFLSILPNNLIVIIYVFLRFQKKSLAYSIFTITHVLLSAILTIIAVLYYDFGIMGVVVSGTLSSYIILTIALLSMSKSIDLFYFDISKFKLMFSYSAPQFPARIGSVANVYANRFFMMSMLSAASLGLYSVSLRVASGMQLIQNAFILTWLPFFYEILKKEDFHQRFQEVYKYSIIFLSLIVIVLGLFSKEIILFLTNEEYIESYKMVSILAFYYALFIFKEIVDVGVKVTNKTKYNSYIYLSVSFINIGLLFIFIPLYGLYGVCISLLLSNLLLFILTMWNSVILYPSLRFPIFFTLFWIGMTSVFVVLLMYKEFAFQYRFLVSCIVVFPSMIVLLRKIKLPKKHN